MPARVLLVAPVATAATGNEATAARLCAVLAAADCDVHVIDADTASPEVLALYWGDGGKVGWASISKRGWRLGGRVNRRIHQALRCGERGQRYPLSVGQKRALDSSSTTEHAALPLQPRLGKRLAV